MEFLLTDVSLLRDVRTILGTFDFTPCHDSHIGRSLLAVHSSLSDKAVCSAIRSVCLSERTNVCQSIHNGLPRILHHLGNDDNAVARPYGKQEVFPFIDIGNLGRFGRGCKSNIANCRNFYSSCLFEFFAQRRWTNCCS